MARQKIRRFKSYSESVSFGVRFTAGFILLFVPVFISIFLPLTIPQWLIDAAARLELLLGGEGDGESMILIIWGAFALLIVPITIGIILRIRSRNKVIVEIDLSAAQLGYYKHKKLKTLVDLHRNIVVGGEDCTLEVTGVGDYISGNGKSRSLQCESISRYDAMVKYIENYMLSLKTLPIIKEILQTFVDIMEWDNARDALVEYVNERANLEYDTYLPAYLLSDSESDTDGTNAEKINEFVNKNANQFRAFIAMWRYFENGEDYSYIADYIVNHAFVGTDVLEVLINIKRFLNSRIEFDSLADIIVITERDLALLQHNDSFVAALSDIAKVSKEEARRLLDNIEFIKTRFFVDAFVLNTLRNCEGK